MFVSEVMMKFSNLLAKVVITISSASSILALAKLLKSTAISLPALVISKVPFLYTSVSSLSKEILSL